MEILPTGKKNVWVGNDGMEILSTRNKDCLGCNDGMEILLTGKNNVWVSMKAWKSCQQ